MYRIIWFEHNKVGRTILVFISTHAYCSFSFSMLSFCPCYLNLTKKMKDYFICFTLKTWSNLILSCAHKLAYSESIVVADEWWVININQTINFQLWIYSKPVQGSCSTRAMCIFQNLHCRTESTMRSKNQST